MNPIEISPKNINVVLLFSMCPVLLSTNPNSKSSVFALSVVEKSILEVIKINAVTKAGINNSFLNSFKSGF